MPAIGLVINLYNTRAVFEQARSLNISLTPEAYMILPFFIYKFFCLILIARYALRFFCHLKVREKDAMFLYLLFTIFSVLSILQLPYPKPLYLYKFDGFVAGVKENINEQKFRNWVDRKLTEISNEDGVSIEVNELAFLSKSGIMACDGVVRKYDSKYYEVMLIWGSALSGHYGLLVSNDPKKIDYLKKGNDVIEVYKDVWAWTENK